MKYEIVGIAHAVGDFTPPAGKNADTVRHYDVHLHRKGTIPYCGSIGFKNNLACKMAALGVEKSGAAR